MDNRSPIGTGASRSVDPVDATGGVGLLLGESERTNCNHDDDREVFHFNDSGLDRPSRCRIQASHNMFFSLI